MKKVRGVCHLVFTGQVSCIEKFALKFIVAPSLRITAGGGARFRQQQQAIPVASSSGSTQQLCTVDTVCQPGGSSHAAVDAAIGNGTNPAG